MKRQWRQLICILWVAFAASVATESVAHERLDPQGAISGRVLVTEPLLLPTLGRSRQLRIYLPPGYHERTDRYPVVYMHDGQNLFDEATSFAGEWGIDETLDELARTKGTRLIVVGIDNGGDKRIHELNPYDHAKYGKGEGAAYVQDLVNTIKLYVDRHYRTRPQVQHTLIMGSSLGGLISHYAALSYPTVFGSAGIFSPAYWIAEPIFEATADSGFKRHQRLYFLMGGAEGDSMVPDFKRMQRLVAASTHEAQFALVPHGEHREAFWRAQFLTALSWLLADGSTAAAETVASP